VIKRLNNKQVNARSIYKTMFLGAIGLACLGPSSGSTSAQTTNILNTASCTAYSSGNLTTGYNGGFGAGTLTLNTPGGGHYSGGGIFSLWNNACGASTGSFANRSFGSALAGGQTLFISLKNVNLRGSYEEAGFDF
jgi:hypothetical protein